jgi:hypothetical protein
MKLKLLSLAISFFVSYFAFAQNKNTVSHDAFNTLLQKHVSSKGKVNYKALKADKANLDAYTAALAKQIPNSSWSKNASLAYWINAYNAFTLKLIVENYPLKSITNLSGGKPWDVKNIDLAGKKYSLNNIENDIIRPQFKDARIHFAVNCAAVSCPPLANTAFTEANINSLLDARTKSFINSAENSISATSLKVSKIFDWYGADFGNVTTFVNKYSNKKVDAKVAPTFNEYNWALNDK